MNVINFGDMAICNFKSIGDEVKFNYGDLSGMSYVIGENLDLPELRNGVGKSVIFVDALLMVLFGQVANNVKNKELFHRSAKSNIGWIKLQMFVNTQEWNVHCVFSRSKTGNVSLTRDLYKGEVHEDNSKSKSSMAGTMKYLADEIIQSDADTFKNAVVLSTSNIQNFFTLPRPAKDAYLDSVFTLAAFGELYADIKKSLNQLKRELSSQREVHDALKESHRSILAKSEAFIEERKTELQELMNEITAKKALIDELNSQVTNVAELEANKKKLESKLAKFEKDLKKLNTDREKIKETIGDHRDETDAFAEEQMIILDGVVYYIKTKIDEIKTKIDIINTVIEDINADRTKFNEQIKENETKIEYLREHLTVAESRKIEVRSELSQMMAIKKKFGETYDMLCVDCQKKTADHFEFDQDAYNILEVETADLQTKCDKLINSMQPFYDAISKIQGDVDKLDAEENDFVSSIATLQSKIVECDNKIATARTIYKDTISEKEKELMQAISDKCEDAVKDNINQSQKLSAQIDVCKDEIRAIGSELTRYEFAINRVNDETNALKEFAKKYKKKETEENPFESLVVDGEKKLAVAKTAIKAILKDQRKYELLSNIYGEDGVKRHIVSNIVASLNILIKKYLAEMGTDYTVIFDDKFQYNFYTVTGECEYLSFSSGERRRLDMAVMLALRDILFTNGLVTNILIVDEVLDSGIDGYALFAILNILKNKTKESSLGCIVISHRNEILQDLTDTFDRVITVVKEGGESSIKPHTY